MSQVGGRFFDERSPHLDNFGALLTMSAATVAGMSLFDLDPGRDDSQAAVEALAVSLAIGTTFLLAMRASGVVSRWRRLADAAVILGLSIGFVLVVIDLTTDAALSGIDPGRVSPIWVAIAVITPVSVVRRLMSHRRVTRGTILGAISAYLLIAVAFTYVFLYLDGVQDGGFFATAVDQPSTSFMYFSLSSITTVGYGDLAAGTPAGRLMATSEAVIGQVYLVTFVAMLVALFVAQRSHTD